MIHLPLFALWRTITYVTLKGIVFVVIAAGFVSVKYTDTCIIMKNCMMWSIIVSCNMLTQFRQIVGYDNKKAPVEGGFFC